MSRVRDSRSYFSTVSGDTDSAGTETTSAVPSFVSAGSCCRSSYSSVSDHDHFGTDVVVDRSSRQDELAVEVDAVVDSMGVDPPHRGEVLVESAESHLVSVDLGLRSVERSARPHQRQFGAVEDELTVDG